MSDTPASPAAEAPSDTIEVVEFTEIEAIEEGQEVEAVEIDVVEIAESEPQSTLDLAAIARDLDGVEQALGRLDAGTYWTDEITGAPLPDDLLAVNPVARHL